MMRADGAYYNHAPGEDHIAEVVNVKLEPFPSVASAACVALKLVLRVCRLGAGPDGEGEWHEAKLKILLNTALRAIDNDQSKFLADAGVLLSTAGPAWERGRRFTCAFKEPEPHFQYQGLARWSASGRTATSRKASAAIRRPLPFNLILEDGDPIATRDEKSVDFDNRGKAWRLFKLLAQAHPSRVSAADLARQLWQPGHEAVVYATIKQVRELIKVIGLTVSSRRGRGYVLEVDSRGAARRPTPQARRR